MNPKFKVWASIEYVNDDKYIYLDTETPMCIASFATLTEANDYVEKLAGDTALSPEGITNMERLIAEMEAKLS